MNRFSPTELQAWVDGELDPGRSREVEAELARNPEARAFCDHLRSVRNVLQEHPPLRTVPDTREFYWSKIRRRIEEIEKASARNNPAPQPRSPWGNAFRWLAWLVPAGAVALTAILFLRSAGDRPVTPVDRNVASHVMAGHQIEAPDVGLTTLTFYSAQDSMTVVWLGKADSL